MEANYSSPNALSLALLSRPESVFTVSDVAMYTGVTSPGAIARRMLYAVRNRILVSPRKGFYARPGYSIEEMACRLYVPSYISLEYVLQREGVIFQYSSVITSVARLSREVDIDGRTLSYRKIKDSILIDTSGIEHGTVNIATKERAFLDMLYLNANCHFDNPGLLDRSKVEQLLPIYNSKTMAQRAINILDHV